MQPNQYPPAAPGAMDGGYAQNYPPNVPQGYPAQQPMSVQTAPPVPYGPAPGYAMPAYPYPGQVSGPATPGMPPMSNGPGGLPQMPAFSDPSAGGGGASVPSIAELAGRAIIAVPTAYDPNAKGYGDKANEIVPSVTFDAYVLDGGPLAYGAAPRAVPPRPNPVNRVDTVPVLFKGIMSSNVNIVRALKDQVRVGVVLGRIVQGVGTKGNMPWNLQALDAADPAKAIADAVRAAVNAGTFVSPPVVELVPQQQAQQVPPAYHNTPQPAPPGYGMSMGAVGQYPQGHPGQVPPGYPPLPPGY